VGHRATLAGDAPRRQRRVVASAAWRYRRRVPLVWSVVLALPLFLASTVVFDVVHWALHRMLRARAGWLRALAWPHSVHPRWLDRQLSTRWEYQRLNIWCHIVPEYLTQIAFSALCLTVLPAGPVMATVVLQTVVFLLILRERGLDLNHRAIAVLDAYPPAIYCPPAYHALHHVHPDAHMSAYLKVVDWLAGTGAQIAGRRYAVAGETPLGRALAAALDAAGALATDADAAEMLIVAEPRLDRGALIEAYLDVAQSRQVPPEVWAVQERVDDGLARHYYRDVRVVYRALVVPDVAQLDDAAARRVAGRVLRAVQRGFNFVPARSGPLGLAELWRFRRTVPLRPASARAVRHRAELRAAA
jgi:hypothetical protein